jgi:hypothetical protein
MVADPTSDRRLDAADVEARLVALERASDERRAELRSQLDRLPHAVSRRSVMTSMLGDLRAAPDKPQIVQRGLRKVMRIPRALIRRVVRRS